MNYIRQLQADKAEALDSTRSIEAAINHLISYLSTDRAAARIFYAVPVGHEELFIDLHDHLPKELIYERELLICRL
jgi:hypothetical protein